MSPAPTVASETTQQEDGAAFRKAVTRQMELISEGMSNSGRERNCCFLNIGAGRFANISAASGLDHIGDGRAYALTDWDHDGDVDIWATNRTGPRVQFFRNNGTPGNHFLVLKLQGNGTTVNRDAIGARVEVVLRPSNDKRLIKSVRAGDGFLSQSAKSLVFGLGRNSQVNRLIVQWPGGDKEEFTSIEIDRHYLIVQGSGRPRPWVRPGGEAELTAARGEMAKEGPQGRVQLRYRIPLPTIEYEELGGKILAVDFAGGKPTLVNLWASWCQPCMRELVDFRKHEAELRSRGLNVLALSVDKVAEDDMSNPKGAAAFLSRQQFPFDAGFATARFMQTLDAVHFFLYGVQRHTTVPASFLLDGQGRLAVIYIGRLEIDDLLSDIDQLALGDLPWFEAALPFAGIWLGRPPQPDLASLVDAFVDRNLAKEARHYFDRYSDILAGNSKLPNLLVQLGSRLGQQGDLTAAERRFRQAIEADPQNANAHFQLGKVYLLQRKFTEALHHAQRAVDIRPDFKEAHFVLATLQEHLEHPKRVINHLEALVRLEPGSVENRMLLGGAYVKAQQWSKAVEQLRQAATLAPNSPEAHYQLGLVLESSGQSEAAADAFAEAGRLNPKNAKRQFGLALGLANSGDIDGAIRHFRMAQRLDPESSFVMNGLAWMIVSKDNPDQRETSEALRLSLLAAEKTNYRQPQMLDTLAAAYALSGDYDNAVSTAKKAIVIAEADNDKQLAAEIRTRLVQYERREPYSPPESKQNSND